MKLPGKLSDRAIAKLTGLSRHWVDNGFKATGDVVPKATVNK
jgi:hypothetical protein